MRPHLQQQPQLTFLPFLVGVMFSLALSWKVCLSTCLTRGSRAICSATMYRAPSSTASGVGNWLWGQQWSCRMKVSLPSGHPSFWPSALCPPANVIFGQLQGLCRKLFRLMSLVAVTEVLPKLLRCEAKLFGQAIYSKQRSAR